MKRDILIFTITLMLLCSCRTNYNDFELQKLPIQITGSIEGFKGGYKTGLLEYYDAVTQLRNNEIFLIDSLGNFNISFELIHPIIGSTILRTGDNEYYDFYLEPGKIYTTRIVGYNLFFLGESGEINEEISIFKDSLLHTLGTKIQEADLLHEKELSIEKYISFQKRIEKEKSDYLNNYHQKYSLSEKAFKILQGEIKYKTAHAWINYRYDYSIAGTRILRDSFPIDLYERLFNEYPINEQDDIQSINCNHYISNIVSVLENMGNTLTSRIDFIRSFDYFKPKELEMLYLLYSGDTAVIKSTEYSNFNSQENWDKLRELYFCYNFNRVLDNITLLDQGLMRDLVVSQAISKNYFANNYYPSISEWELVEDAIQNKAILNHLQAISVELQAENQQNHIEDEAVGKSIDDVKKKYIDKYLGKVVYIDFYATWCSPCREEIPYAKALHYEIENSNVVFLNLCAQSRKEDWEAYIEQNGIEGENYLLSKEEMNLLSILYNVEGFPTYVLIDRDGNVSNYNAPRPSEKEFIIKEIGILLDS